MILVKVKMSRSFSQVTIFSFIKNSHNPSQIEPSESHLIKVKVMWPRSRSFECLCPRPHDIIQGQISSCLDHLTQTITKQSNKYWPCLLIKSTFPLFFHIFLLSIYAFHSSKMFNKSFQLKLGVFFFQIWPKKCQRTFSKSSKKMLDFFCKTVTFSTIKLDQNTISDLLRDKLMKITLELAFVYEP